MSAQWSYPRLSCRRNPGGPRARGATLVELMVVIGLVAILAGMGGPGFVRMVRRYRLDAAARATVSYINLARVLAVSRGTPVRVFFGETETFGGSSFQPLSGATKGLFRLERMTRSSPETWELIDKQTGDALAGDTSCTVNRGGGPTLINEYCVDFKTQYPSISVAVVDPVPLSQIGKAYLIFGADGIITNSQDDFSYGSDKTAIKIVLTIKPVAKKIEGKILSIDRGGSVKVQPFVGTNITDAT